MSEDRNITCENKVRKLNAIRFCKQCMHDLQFMKTWSSSPNLYKLARADISYQFMKTRSLCRHCIQNEWTLALFFMKARHVKVFAIWDIFWEHFYFRRVWCHIKSYGMGQKVNPYSNLYGSLCSCHWTIQISQINFQGKTILYFWVLACRKGSTSSLIKGQLNSEWI